MCFRFELMDEGGLCMFAFRNISSIVLLWLTALSILLWFIFDEFHDKIEIFNCLFETSITYKYKFIYSLWLLLDYTIR